MSGWNWSVLCGHGEDIETWIDQDFGHCFEKVAILAPSHALLAIISAYYLGHCRQSVGHSRLYVKWTWFLILRQLTTVILLLSPICQVVFSVTSEHQLPDLAESVVIGLSGAAWLIHACFVWNIRYLHSYSLRGPLSVMAAVGIVLVASGTHVHTVILRHINTSLIQSYTEEFTTYVNSALCLLYIFSLVPGRPRAYQASLAFRVNEEEEEESEPLTWGRIQRYHSVDVPSQPAPVTAEFGVNCLSWITFHWVQKLMSRGARGKISSVEDLYLLPRRLDTNSVDTYFEKMLKSSTSNDDPCLENLQRELTQHDNDCSALANSAASLNNHRSTDTSNDPHGSKDNINSYSGPESSTSSYRSTRRNKIRPSLKQNSLFRVLIRAFGLEYFLLGILKFLADSASFAGPILLNLLVSLIESKTKGTYEGYLYAFGLFMSTLISTICSTQFDYNVQVVAYKIRCALITTIYRKSLTVNSVAQSKFTSGEIVNFMSTDTDRILNFCPSFHAFWSLPFQVAVALFLLYQQLGLAFLAGVGFAVLLVPINRWIAQKIGQLSTEMMKFKDDRVKLMNELLSGIRVVKFYSWERHFTHCVGDLRNKELQYLKGRKFLDALCVFFWATTPVLISILTFATHVLMGHTLTAAKVFTCLSLFLMLISPLNAFPWVINGLVEAWVSLKRVHQFVSVTDSNLRQYYACDRVPEEKIALYLRDASFTWSRPDLDSGSLSENSREESRSLLHSGIGRHALTLDLQNISLVVEKGSFVGITGRVGSGKSSLLNAIIGEMNKTQGEIFLDDIEEGVALACQEPWIQHATVRENILFGSPFNSHRYKQVLKACALVEDLRAMPSGDMTEVGENGITLSGGQRSRIALARAVYQDKSLYLLDDPLSAVDAHVAKHLYTHCIMGLLRSKTRILCTHHVRYLKKADWVVVMEDGTIAHSGVPSEVLPHVHLDDELPPDHPRTQDQEATENSDQRGDDLMQEEERQTGAVKTDVYKSYWRAVGTCLSTLVLITLLFMQATRNASDWWLSYWVSHSSNTAGTTGLIGYLLTLVISTLNSGIVAEEDVSSGKNRQLFTTNLTSGDDLRFYLGVYGGLAGANSVFTFARAFLFAYGGICAAVVVHQRLLSAILKAPLSFFETTPIGRIVNRFSSDLYAVDDSLPFTLNILLAQAFGMLGTLIITSYGLPWFLLCLVPMGALYYKIQHYYRHTSRELKRLSSVTLSPIYAHFSETVAGVATIRAMRHSNRFFEENKLRLGVNQRCQYATQLSARWIDFRLQMLGVAMVTSLSLIAVIQHHLSSVSAGLVGLAISYSLSVTNLLGGVVMFFTETEKEFVSMERCQYYIEHTPSEKWEGTLFAPTSWPTQGVVQFEAVCLQYRDTLSLALSDVSFKTKTCEKIGIVGRTGAGKSSLLLALFRLVELKSGRILVDDVDVRYLDLSDVRSHFAAIPQDPVLFSGSIRMNLDPTGQHPDTELWQVLDRCHLKVSVDRMGGLDTILTQGGREFSVGQRQLLCLARAMLTKAKILCIDEATASIDLQTDALIQNTIRQEFRSSTVFTIAHRVNTVLDSDRVMVLKDGTLAEFDSPAVLLLDPNSLFYGLAYENR